jgi:magnesium transporter
MNFHFMPELEKPWAYPLVWGIMALIALGMILFFKRRKWM